MEDGVVDVGSEEKMEVLSDMVVDKVFIKVQENLVVEKENFELEKEQFVDWEYVNVCQRM